MSRPLQPAAGPHVPDLEQLEQSAALVERELAALLGRARDVFSRLQDVDVEIAAGSAKAIGQRMAIAHELRVISQLLTVAHTWLVYPDDDRHGASVRVRGWAVEAIRADGQWKQAA